MAAFTTPRSRLVRIVGEDSVFDDQETLSRYAADESPVPPGHPDMVVLPRTGSELAAIVSECYDLGLPVVPRGLGTGLTGGSVASSGGVVVGTERMNRIIDIDEENFSVTVEPGVITGVLQAAVESRGLFYPPDPASLDSCSIGGNVAVNSGGPRTLKYGVTRNYLTGLRAVLPGGIPVSYGGKVMKNSTGYDLAHLLVGTEGTLGVITQATFRLLPLPPATLDLLVPFASFDTAARAVTAILNGSHILPAVLEFMDLAAVMCSKKALGTDLPFRPNEAQLLIQVDGCSESDVAGQAEMIADICLRLGADDVLAADKPPERERLWKARRIVIEAARSEGTRVELQDVVVPRARIPELLVGTRDACARAGLPLLTVGHAGDGNVHFALYDRGVDAAVWEQRLPRVMLELADLVLKLGGVIAGEHGIGSYKRHLLDRAVGQVERGLMGRIKDALDPRGLMNPGKAI